MSRRMGPVSAALLLTVTSCTSGRMTMTQQAHLLDERYQQAFEAVQTLPEIRWVPCTLMVGGEKDYRYTACFRDLSGSAAQTMQALHALLTRAGFKKEGSGSDASELDASFTLPGTPYSLNTTFGSIGINWTVYQQGRGHVAPRTGTDDPRIPYALLSPFPFAYGEALAFFTEALPNADPGGDRTRLRSCGQPSETKATVCISQAMPERAALWALTNLYFIGYQDVFATLDRQPTFVSHAEEAFAVMIKKGLIGQDYKSSLTFTKTGQGRYTVTDSREHPGYQVSYQFTPAGQKTVEVQITAERLATAKSAQAGPK